jgi:hypothetical protein
MNRKVRMTAFPMYIRRMKFVASMRQHYMTTEITSLSVPVGKKRGGTTRIGEMEIPAMMMNGLPGLVIDSIRSSDACLTIICKKCRHLEMNCDCLGKVTPETVITRKSLMELDILMTMMGILKAEREDLLGFFHTTLARAPFSFT